MTFWGPIIGAGIGVVGSIIGGSKSASAAKSAAKSQNEATERQYEYDLEMYKLNQDKIQADRLQAVDNILLQAENEKRSADFQDASNLRNYQYNLQIRNREQESLNQQYIKSELLYDDQITLNTLAERTAQDNEYRKLEDIKAEASFDAEEAYIKQIIAEGQFRARGVKGGTAAKATQVTYADLGSALSRINESTDNAGRMARAVLEEISQDRVSADLAAFAQRMLPPGTLPAPLVPLATPRATFQLPREIGPYDWGPEPVKGAYASPSAAANKVWGTTIAGIAGTAGKQIGAAITAKWG
mgnify:CR=1 FL=1|tara:strand:+ start:49 stop:948 length:900 start_codon:yes stop_codon:yes gene_type:complete